MISEFIAPARLVLLLAVPVLAVVYALLQLRQKKYAVRFSNTHLLDKVAPKRPGWRRHVVAAGFLAALGLMIMSIAQPASTVRVPRERATVMLAIDTSLSMEAADVAPTRIQAAKTAAADFIDALPDKLQLGLVAFDENARVVVPPTTDRNLVINAVNNLELDEGTAIGDAVEVSLDAIANTPIDDSGEPVPGVVVLLSDGKTTVGTPTEDAIPSAVAAEVPVWTIAYGTPSGTVDIDIDGSGQKQRIAVPVDPEALVALASGTSGQAYSAATATDLSEVYAEMGSSIGYADELQDITWKMAAAATLLMAAVSVLSLAWFQRLP